MGSRPATPRDHDLVSAVNRRTDAALTAVGRAEEGRLGGAIYAEWPDGRPAVLTRCLVPLAEARRTADVLAHVRARGLPVPRHDLVVALADGVVFVQERLPCAPRQRLTTRRIDAIVEINDRFAGALADRPDVPVRPLGQYRRARGAQGSRHTALRRYGTRGLRVLDEILRLCGRRPTETTETDLVHIDLTAANVLFDECDTATAVVDWNLGAYRGDRHFALVKTRFDREWFVRSPDADPVETAAAAHLDGILADRIPAETLRIYWAHWMLYQLDRAIRTNAAEAVEWHLEMAESRLG